MRDVRVTRYRGRYAVTWYDETDRRHRRSLGKVAKSEAYAVANRVIAAATTPREEVKTVGQIVDAYLESTEAIGRDIMRLHWKAAKQTFADLLPAQVTSDACRLYARGRVILPKKEGRPVRAVKPGTILKELGVIRTALHRAKVEPASMWFPQKPLPRDRRLTRAEFAALEAECKQPHLLLFVMIARYTAARASAILSLKWSALDFEQRRIDLGGSGRQKRRAIVPMHPHLALALVIAREAALSPYVVEYGGRRCASIKKGFRAACGRAKIADVTPHVLRHTAASWMAEGGVSMDEIAQFLGHTNPSVTFRVYARYSPTFLQRAAEALG